MKFFGVQALLGKFPPEGELPGDRQVLSETIKIAWPSILESFLVSLVGVVDTMMVGTMGSSAIAAVGLTNQPKFAALSVFFSLNVAVSAIVARRRGERDPESANGVLKQALAIAMVLVAVISVLCVRYAEPIMRFVGGEPEIIPMASGYYRIIMAGLVFTVISLVINAAQRGAGNTKIAMRTNLVSNGVNVVLNYLLIGGKFGFPALGADGAAIATVAGSVVACFMSIASTMRKNSFISLRKYPKLRFDKQSLVSIANVGSSSLVEQLFLRIGFMTYSIIVAKLGTTDLAAHLVAMNILSVSFSLGDGLSVASVALVGRSLGEKRRDLAKVYANLCMRIGIVFSVSLSIICFFTGKQLFMLFTDDVAVLMHQRMLTGMIILIFNSQIAQVILFGCLRGSGDTKYTALVSLVSVATVRPISGWLLCYPMGLGLLGAWIGLLLDQIVRLVLSWTRFKGGKWMNNKV